MGRAKKDSVPEIASKETYLKAFRYWRSNPSHYIDSVLLKALDTDLEPRQREVMEAVFKYKRVLVPTHFSFGKSFLCALIALAIPNIYPHNSLGTTFAPTFRQVRDILWREMNRVFTNVNKDGVVLEGKITTVRYEIGEGALVAGVSPAHGGKNSTTNNQNMSGRHDYVVFIIVDEAGGISNQVWEMIEALQSSGQIVYVICIGNPLDLAGKFGQMCTTEQGEGFKILQYTAYTSPNMIANGLVNIQAIRKEGMRLREMDRDARLEWFQDKHYKKPYPFLISPGFVMQRYLKWGESPLFFSYCIGEWASTYEDVLVNLQRATEIMLGTYVDETGETVWESEERGYCKWDGDENIYCGLDCSGEGVDKNSLIALEGNRQVIGKNFSKTWERNDVDFRGTSLKEDGPYIANWIRENVVYVYKGRKVTIAIDCTGGFGNSVYDSLRNMHLDPVFITIKKINFGSEAIDNEQYCDIIAQMAWELAKQIESQGGLLLEPNEDLKNQLTNRKKKQGSKLRNMLERKKDYKARAGSSPDEFDALMMANFVRLHGNDKISSAVDKLAESMEGMEKAIRKSGGRNW